MANVATAIIVYNCGFDYLSTYMCLLVLVLFKQYIHTLTHTHACDTINLISDIFNHNNGHSVCEFIYFDTVLEIVMDNVFDLDYL